MDPLDPRRADSFSLVLGLLFAILRTDISNATNLQRISTLALRQRQAKLWRSLQPPVSFIHASLLKRFLKCGRPNCHCRQGQKHGPFFYLNRSLGRGRMFSLLLKSPAQVAQARLSVEAYRQLLDTLDQLSWINLELLRRGTATPSTPPPR